MRKLFIAAASALFFAYLIAELSVRLWPDNQLALLLIAIGALFLSGLLNIKLAELLGARASAGASRAGAPATSPARRQPSQLAQERTRDGGRSRDDAARQGRSNRPADRQDNGDGRSSETSGPRPSRPAPAVAEGPRENGTVKWFNRTKGFGFVIRESGDEIFVHQRSIRSIGEGDERRRPALRDGQSVSFYVAERDKGLQAEDVVPTEE